MKGDGLTCTDFQVLMLPNVVCDSCQVWCFKTARCFKTAKCKCCQMWDVKFVRCGMYRLSGVGCKIIIKCGSV